MHLKLSPQERSSMKSCVCPRIGKGVASSPSARALGYIIIAFVIIDGIVALFLPLVALIIIGIILIFGIITSCWYLVRGHSLKCAFLEGFTLWILFLLDGVIGGV